jgi:hypothetical protein
LPPRWSGAFGGKQRVPFSFHRFDLREKQFEPIEFTANPRLQMFGHGTAIARLQVFQPQPAVAPQRLVIADPLREEQSLDSVDCSTRSATTVLRSREIRPRSSASGVGALTMEHTRGSPRL